MTSIQVTVPDIGTDDAVDVIEISVAVGDQVSAEQTLLVLESAKASIEVPAPAAGKITEIKTDVGQQVKFNDLIFVMQGQDAHTKTSDSVEQECPSESEEAEAQSQDIEQTIKEEEKQETKAAVSSSNTTTGLVHAGPAVRRLANQMGVDLAQVTGTGPKQRILKEDVKAYVKQRLQAGASTSVGNEAADQLPSVDFSKWGDIETKPMTKIQQLSAQNLSRAWRLIPHVTQFDEAPISALEAFRQSENKQLKAQGVKLTLLAFLLKACAKALNQFPKFKASLSPDGTQLIYKYYCHIGFAADTEQGLVVPVIFDVDQKSLIQIAQELTELSEKARAKKLSPKEMQGACFTISSLGGIGGTAFTPIVNWPEVAILGVSKSQTRVVMHQETCSEVLVLPLSLSYDHRVIDGADAARFTSYLSYLLTDLKRLLL